MSRRDLQWYGAVPNATKSSAIRRCILQYTSESMDVVKIFGRSTHAFRIFGMEPSDATKRDGTIPFTYKNRFFLAIYREDFLVVFEDRSEHENTDYFAGLQSNNTSGPVVCRMFRTLHTKSNNCTIIMN